MTNTLILNLQRARDALKNSAYQTRYMAMDRDEKACSPRLRGCALSYRGAFIRVTFHHKDREEVWRFLELNRLLPSYDPRTKEDALAMADLAIKLAQAEEKARQQHLEELVA